ncbi:MAG: type I restriction endonuclease subunit R [Clostridium sp.]|nr:type I restriction endonuclease subunit R [Clostridium sp.]
MQTSFTESSFENAVLELFQNQGYKYQCGYDLHRTNEEIFIVDDFKDYLSKRYALLNLQESEINFILHNLLSSRGTSLYSTMKATLCTLQNGITLDRSAYGMKDEFIEYFDFSNVENNVFKVVNQFEVKDAALRRPDIVIFINGIPVSVIELKTVSEEGVKLYSAFEQLTIRYTRDIENLMRFSFISVISDGVNTKCGSIFSDYKHFFPWKSTDGKSYVKDGVESLTTMISGLFDHATLLNLIQNYIYFPDTSKNNLMILPKYSQYYASELLFQNIKEHMRPSGDGKGGTYFGATGCGKSYTMLFLTRRLVTSPDLNSPTVILLTDRTDLDDQLSSTFEASKEYLIDRNTLNVASREELNEKVKGVTSGGIFLMTVQKFDENVKLLSNRDNIICISDEAHRTQVNLDATLKIDEEGIKKHFGFATYLRNSFPNATYVGFTGTPIDATINVFGAIVAAYKMKQAVDDGSTVGIALLPGPSAVRLDEAKMGIVDRYYADQLSNGTNKYEVNESIKEMSKVRTIIDNDSRLNLIVDHFISHYENRVKEGATVKGKAMFVCYDRNIAYKVYKKIIARRPEWNIPKKTQEDESKLTYSQLNRLKPVEMVKLVATRGANDEPNLYNLLGSDKYRSELATLFKDENSNFKIAIVVDMWLTGFDCASLDTMYIDKPLEKHTLIQTISRVNRVFEGKDKGLIVDYIGIEASLAKAMQLYSGDINPVSEIEASYVIFKDQMSLIDNLMDGFDYSKFESGTDLDRLLTLQKGMEFVQMKEDRETRFMGLTQRMKKAFDICVGDSRITNHEMFKLHFYCAIHSAIMKIGREGTPDAERMNQEVKKLVDGCISALKDQKEGEQTKTEIFSEEYLKKIQGIPYKNTKFKMLIEMLRKAITQYSHTNKYKAEEFSKRMKRLVDKYNNRDGEILVSNDDVINDFIDSLSEEAQKILEDLKKDSDEFKKMGISFEEKAFYDILKAIRDKYGFEFSEEKIIDLAKKVKVAVDDKAKYTDWSSKSNIKASLQSDIIRILNRNGYPPVFLNGYPQNYQEVYEKVLAQVENYKKYDD